EQQKNEFYATGYSYGGKYIPAIAQKITKESNPIINLKGIAVGNGFFDPYTNIAYGPYLYQLSLIDENQKLEFDRKEKEIQQLIDSERLEEAFRAMDVLILKALVTEPTYFNNCTGYNHYYDFLLTNDPIKSNAMVALLNKAKVHKAIHVGKHEFILGGDTNFPVINALIDDFMRSVKDIVVDLLNSNCRVLFYSGNLDIVIPPVFTTRFLDVLNNWKYRDEYLNSERKIWKLTSNADVAGYIKKATNFDYVVLRNAGHMVPFFQPRVMYSLIINFVQNEL
ncbi:putative serine carboxypeptidase CPVL-like protein, partial [Leptotrombidium deliense]